MSGSLRKLFGLGLGKRLPKLDGTLRTPGIKEALSIRRDGFGIPHINAANDCDAWYGLGFCHGQDRAFQLESLLRVTRGTVAELVGGEGLAIDRLSRRIGFRRNSREHLEALNPRIRDMFDAYARGVTSGATIGSPKRAHEFALLASSPSPWAAEDVVAMLRLQAFLFATNADAELARLKILSADGAEALWAIDPCSPSVLSSADAAGVETLPLIDRLNEDLLAFAQQVGAGGGSNGWAISGRLTASGKPILANDPHLPALLPSPWYLAHLTTPDWSTAGATLVGGPAVLVGHNGFAAWGLTAALFDTTDLFLEKVGPDGASVLEGEDFRPCERRREVIKVRFGRNVVEDVLVTGRGPVVGPALEGSPGAVSLKVFWLDARPVEGIFRAHLAKSFDEFRLPFKDWPAPALNMMYADSSGDVGWQLVGGVPQRKKGWGTIPLPGWDTSVGWEDDPVPFDQMPLQHNPEWGFAASANTRPYPDVDEPFLGVDWIDSYRLLRIWEALQERDDWDGPLSRALQLDDKSLPWEEMKELVLSVLPLDTDARTALSLLSEWDGRVAAGSAGASVFELFVADMTVRVARAKVPGSAAWALGMGFAQLLPYTSFSFRRVEHLIRLLRSAPEGWFSRSWPEEVSDSLSGSIRRLKTHFGHDPAAWNWGKVRPVTLRHPVSERKPLNRIFDIGPVFGGGDSNTIAQTSVDPLNPEADPGFIPSLRVVIEVDSWEEATFVLPAGQSGNPCSDHYRDQLPLYEKGEGVSIAWSEEVVQKATVHTLELLPPSR